MKGLCNHLGFPVLLQMHVSLNFTVIKALYIKSLCSILQKQIPMWLKFSMLGFLHARNDDFVLICSLFCPVHHGFCDHKGRAKIPAF